MSNFFGNVRIDTFTDKYRVYSGAFFSKSHIDEGGKIILPQSTLDKLANLHIVWPIMFKLTNPARNVTTHCGVLEFSAEEGRAYIPFWMLEHLQLKPGDVVSVQTSTLAKGSYVKLRPQQKAFIENISDPKAILEQKLRNFSCLTRGDTIMLSHLGENYCIDIMDVRARNNPHVDAISIVETDVEVDFERPLDMPPSPVAPVSTQQLQQHFDQQHQQSTTLTGGQHGGEEVFGQKQTKRYKSKKEKEQERLEQEKQEKQQAHAAFQGSGRRLDGKQLRNTAAGSPPVSSGGFLNSYGARSSAASASSSTSLSSLGNKTPQDKVNDNGNGTLYGGSAGSPSGAPSTPESNGQSKFVPFGGKGRSLKD